MKTPAPTPGFALLRDSELERQVADLAKHVEAAEQAADPRRRDLS